MKLIIKGLIIGIGKILPGISGAFLAITLGEYEKIIESIATIKTNFQKNSIYLMKIGIGMIISITLISKVIVKLLNNYYFSTMLLFIGITIGEIIKKAKQEKIKKCDIVIIVIIIIISQLNIVSIKQKANINFLSLIAVGIIDAISSIIPGISGTAMLMALGYYNIIINTFADITKIKNISKNIIVIIPFLIGFIIGTFILARLINYLYKNKKEIIEKTVTFLMVSTTALLIPSILPTSKNAAETIIGTILFIIGFYIKYRHKTSKKE